MTKQDQTLIKKVWSHPSPVCKIIYCTELINNEFTNCCSEENPHTRSRCRARFGLKAPLRLHRTPVSRFKRRQEQNRTEQNRTEQNRTEQNRTEQNRTEQNRTEQNRTEQRERTEQNRTEQNRTEQEQNRREQSRAEQNRA